MPTVANRIAQDEFAGVDANPISQSPENRNATYFHLC